MTGSEEFTHAELALRMDAHTEKLDKIDAVLDDHIAEERVTHTSVASQNAVLERIDRVVFGRDHDGGLSAEVQRMTVKVSIATWVGGALGSATLAMLVALFFQERTPSRILPCCAC